jgi:hydrogenase maturation factor
VTPKYFWKEVNKWCYRTLCCAGGLLCGVKSEDAEGLLAMLHKAGYRDAAVIGDVLPMNPTEQERITVL